MLMSSSPSNMDCVKMRVTAPVHENTVRLPTVLARSGSIIPRYFHGSRNVLFVKKGSSKGGISETDCG